MDATILSVLSILDEEKTMSNRPEIVKTEHLEYLDGLRESGVTNMFGAGAYLQGAFGELASRADAQKVLSYWMESFGKDDR